MSKFERGKDTAQEIIESTAIRIGRIATIITTAVADVAREIGDGVGDALDMRDAAQRAAADETATVTPIVPDVPPTDVPARPVAEVAKDERPNAY